jgi:selenocysteine lyase/cysteine desulfurase
MDFEKKGRFFSDQLLEEIRDKFYYVDSDPYNGKRLYFENAGGSLTLKSVVKLTSEATAFPDSPNRPSLAAKPLKKMVVKGKEDIKLFLGVKSGQVVSSETASRVIFLIIGAIIENSSGTNVVTTFLEHPSSYDACMIYSKKTGKELRIANVNPTNGGVDPEEILSKIDKNTSLLSFIASSNITGKIPDLKTIINKARKINPNLFIFIDTTQHVAHAPINVEELEVYGVAFTPYKMFGKRGIGMGWVSDRVAVLPHERVLEKPIDSWESGSVEPVGFGMFSSIIDYICWIGKHFTSATERRALILSGMKKIELHERALLERALNGTDSIIGLRKMSGVKIHFIPEDEDFSTRDCLLPITIEGKSTSKAVQEYLKNGIVVYDRVRTNPMSRRLLDNMGVKEIIRVTPLHCNSKEEIDEFLRATINIF